MMSSNNAADKAHQRTDQVAGKTHQAIDKTKETADQAKDFAEEGKQTLLDKLREDGVYAVLRHHCQNEVEY